MSKTTDEALARLEHKVDMLLDLIMRAMSKAYVTEMKDGSHECPVCKVGVQYVIDLQDKSITRKCGCKTGLFPPLDLEDLRPLIKKGRTNEQREDAGGSASDRRSSGSERDSSEDPRNR